MIELEIDRRDDGVTVVRPAGRLTMVAAPQLTAAVTDLVAEGRAKFVVDLSQTVFVDSSGLGALIGCLKRARQAGGDLRLAAPTEQVTTILELTNLHRVLRPHDTVDEAGAQL